jgi:hypothetical protein
MTQRLINNEKVAGAEVLIAADETTSINNYSAESWQRMKVVSLIATLARPNEVLDARYSRTLATIKHKTVRAMVEADKNLWCATSE